MSKGIDYGMGQTNIDKSNGIRYGVIPSHDVCQAWADSSEADYGKPDTSDCGCPNCGHNDNEQREWGDSLICEECGESYEVELPDCCEPLAHISTDKDYEARQSNDDCDIFITSSPFYTYAPFCSPCAPGACYLRDAEEGGEKAYCFGHDYFDEGIAPYPVYRVADDTQVVASRETISCPNCKGTGQDSLERIAQVRQCSVDQLRQDKQLIDRLIDLDATSNRFQCWQCGGKGTKEEVVIQ